MVDSTIDKMSIFGLVGSVIFCIKIKPNTSAAINNGSEIQKIQCHVNDLRMRPETVGPTAGANIMTRPIIPIDLPLL